MTYQGYIQNGALVLDAPIDLPEGSRVECVVHAVEKQESNFMHHKGGLYDDLLEFAGKVSGLPEDASENVEHYLYGCHKL